MTKTFEKESEMHPFVTSWLKAKNLTVRSEVFVFDVVGYINNEITIVEMKKTFSTHLIFQACRALKHAEYVWIAIPDPVTYGVKTRANGKEDEIKEICSCIGIGALAISHDGIRIICDSKRSSKTTLKNKEKILKECKGRPEDANIGGTTKVIRMSAYRYRCLTIARYLNKYGDTKAGDIGKNVQDKGYYGILSANHYEWFQKTGRGIYGLTKKGVEAVETYERSLSSST